MSEEKPQGGLQTRFAKIHAKNQARRKVRVIRVKEWDDPEEGYECRLYAYPLTMNQIVAIEAKGGTQAERNVLQIIKQCLDEQGEPFFSIADKPALLNEPADITGKIMIALNGDIASFDKELKKNPG